MAWKTPIMYYDNQTHTIVPTKVRKNVQGKQTTDIYFSPLQSLSSSLSPPVPLFLSLSLLPPSLPLSLLPPPLPLFPLYSLLSIMAGESVSFD